MGHAESSSLQISEGLSGGRTPGCGASKGVGSGVCAWSPALTKRHSPKIAKQRTHLGFCRSFLQRIASLQNWHTPIAASNPRMMRLRIAPTTTKPRGVFVSTAFMNWRSLLVGTIDSRNTIRAAAWTLSTERSYPLQRTADSALSGFRSTLLMCRHREGWVIRVAFCPAAIKRRGVWGIQRCFSLDALN
jgi:hypothetical protein